MSPGRESDVREVVDYLHKKYCKGKHSNRKLYGAGFSIGGNLLAKMVGIDGARCKLTAAYCG